MHPVSGIVVFVVLWWTVLLAVLPWGVRRIADPAAGHDPGAPDRPRLGKKMLWTTLIASLLWGVVYLIIDLNLISFRQMEQ